MSRRRTPAGEPVVDIRSRYDLQASAYEAASAVLRRIALWGDLPAGLTTEESEVVASFVQGHVADQLENAASICQRSPESQEERKILLVGESFPKRSQGIALPLLPRRGAGDRLRTMLGLSDAQYLEIFARTNLCASGWNIEEAVKKAEGLVDARRGVFVLLGARVRRAFSLFLTTRSGDPIVLRPFKCLNFGWGSHHRFACLPHPSGQCRVWNDPENVKRAKNLMMSLIPRITCRDAGDEVEQEHEEENKR